MGVEEQYAPDFLLCAQGRVDEASDAYLHTYDGVTLPGMTADGRGGASVNHMMLAAGIAIYKNPDQTLRSWWAAVYEHWQVEGNWFIEDGTRNTYHWWNFFPALAAAQELGLDYMNELNNSIWARMALGASDQTARFGRTLDVDEGIWRGYASTFCGARSWKYNNPHWSHQEKWAGDWILHWALNDNLSEAPSEHWAKSCIQAGIGSGLIKDERDMLRWVVGGDISDLEDAITMANLGTVREEYTIMRTTDGVATMFHKSLNGNTQFMYGCTFDHNTQWHGWLGHGNGTRNVKQGIAWEEGDVLHCRDNDSTEFDDEPIPTGPVLYVIRVDRRGGDFYLVGGAPPIEPPIPPIDPPIPPEEGALNQSDRNHYVNEIEQMARRQQNLASQLEDIKTYDSDMDVSVQLGHQSNKAQRLSEEIEELLL